MTAGAEVEAIEVVVVALGMATGILNDRGNQHNKKNDNTSKEKEEETE